MGYAAFAANPSYKKKMKNRKRNAERRCSVTTALARGTRLLGRARLSAFHCGSCLRDSRIPKAQLRTRLRGAQRQAPIGGGVLPPAPAPVAASTSHAGHGAGRHDVRNRPGATVTSRRPRAPHSLYQTGSPADILHGSERGFFRSSCGANPRNSAHRSHRFDPMIIFFCSLFAARAPKL